MKYSRTYFFTFLVVTITGLFVWSGGVRLIELYSKYLYSDNSENQYHYQNFTDRGPREWLSGYYAGSIGDSIFVWTYSGLKIFKHKLNTSVYYYMDMCGVIERLAAGEKSQDEKGTKFNYDSELMFRLDEWKSKMKRGDYVMLTRVGEGDDKQIIDKIWATNNPGYPYKKVSLSSCKER